MADYTTTNYLVPAIKRHALVPLAASTLTDADFIAILNEEQLDLAVALAKQRQEFFTRRLVDTPLVAGVDSYAVHSRALGLLLRDAIILQADGRTRDLQLKTLSQLVGTERDSGQPSFVALDGTSLVIRPVPTDAAETLRTPILERPSSLVALSAVGIVSSTSSTQITLSGSAPGPFSTSTPLDVVSGNEPFALKARDITPTVVAGTVVTFGAGVLPSTLVAGDYLCIAKESPVAQIPRELYSALTLRSAANALDSLNHKDRAKAKRDDADKKEARFLLLSRPRLKSGTRSMRNGMDKWTMGGFAPGQSFWRAV